MAGALKVVYISGAYEDKRGEWYVEKNIRAAELAASQVWRLGGVALCPHKNTRWFSGLMDDKVWLDGNLELLKRCDGVYAIYGWQEDEKAVAEVNLAIALGIPVLYELLDVSLFLAGTQFSHVSCLDKG